MTHSTPAYPYNSAERPWLDEAARHARRFLDSLAERPVGARASFQELRDALGGPLPEAGFRPEAVVERLATSAEPGLVASAGPRYFGFVIGGSLPAAVAADWLTTAWDQNGGLNATSPAVAAAEDVVAGWVKDLLGLPAGASVGFVTGCQMANFAGLAAGRHAVLERAGWNVEEEGLQGAPPVNVVLGEEAHATVYAALRLLGLGSRRARRVAVDDQGRLRPPALAEALRACPGPTLVAAQVGNVNTGAIDPIGEIAEIAHGHGAWLHVDGAFGLWAAAAPGLRGQLEGIERADSWATDAHKWLNVPYDSGIAIVAQPDAQRAAFLKRAAYFIPALGAERDPHDYTPESSRRGRVFPLYAALLSLGRRGVAELVERNCALARRIAARLRAGGVHVLNDVALNQVLVRFEPPRGDGDAFNRAVVARIQREGTLWASGTRWRDREALRLSVSNWSTSEADADRSADAILEAAKREAEGR
ncbi:MAG TPA: aminotransferase class V-fold PLP-dependent enzyme [Vicinamibacteria bacterium]|nr:aminotransferase class V-fold PLP-dependent enzyme [Vicinamibacteria bacterium]